MLGLQNEDFPKIFGLDFGDLELEPYRKAALDDVVEIQQLNDRTGKMLEIYGMISQRSCHDIF